MAERIYGAQQAIHNSAPTPPQEPKLNRVHEHLSTEGSQFAAASVGARQVVYSVWPHAGRFQLTVGDEHGT